MDLESYKQREKHSIKESTLNSRLSGLRNFESFIGEGIEPTVEDVEGWAEWMIDRFEDDEVSSATIRQYYKAIKYYFDTMGMDSSELDHISKWLPAESNDHGEYLTSDEWEMMSTAAYSYREDAMIEVMYRYGRRPGEVRLMNMDDVNLDEGTITFNILKKEEPLRATFELLDEPRRKIERYLEHRINKAVDAEHPWEEDEVEPLFTTGNGRISYDAIHSNVKKISNRAGLDKNITPKSMRHSRATHLDWAGATPEEIARHQLVHEPDTQVIGAYIHDREEQQIRETMRLDGE